MGSAKKKGKSRSPRRASRAEAARESARPATGRSDAVRRTARGASRGADPYAVLDVIDKLEVGPVRLGKRKLVAPYVVTRGGQSARFDLIYRYGEDVFDPDE